MKDYDFSDYRTFKELFRDLYYRTITIDDAESKQDEFNTVLHVLKEYSPKNDKYVTLKNYLVDNASKFYKGRENIIEAFEIKIFPFYNDKEYEEQMEFEKEEEQEEIKTDIDKFSKYIAEKEKDINQELFKKHFGFQKPSDIFNSLIDTKDIE